MESKRDYSPHYLTVRIKIDMSILYKIVRTPIGVIKKLSCFVLTTVIIAAWRKSVPPLACRERRLNWNVTQMRPL